MTGVNMAILKKVVLRIVTAIVVTSNKANIMTINIEAIEILAIGITTNQNLGHTSKLATAINRPGLRLLLGITITYVTAKGLVSVRTSSRPRLILKQLSVLRVDIHTKL